MLRSITSTFTACALASTVSLFAQEPAAPQQPAPSPPPSAQQPPAPSAPAATPEVAKETLTGCVIEAKTTAGDKAYVLNDVVGGTAKMYVLQGQSTTEIATNVNKKVEVIGPVQQPNAPPSDDAAVGAQKVLRPPSVQVESVKVVAENCK